MSVGWHALRLCEGRGETKTTPFIPQGVPPRSDDAAGVPIDSDAVESDEEGHGLETIGLFLFPFPAEAVMRLTSLLVVALVFTTSIPMGLAQQRMQKREQQFLLTKPRINDPLPDVTVYEADGSPFKTADLRGHYTVLTFGCLTCPPSMWNIAGLEAVHRDYIPKGVRFYFLYKALAHPELAGNYVQPFTLEERLAQARQAKKQFGTQIPWVVDAMDNRLLHALGDRPNAQFLVNPDGVIVRKRTGPIQSRCAKIWRNSSAPWSGSRRKTDLNLTLNLPPKSPAVRGVVKRIPHPK